MFGSKLGAAIVAVLISVGAMSSAQAGSTLSEAFLANVRPNTDFLEQSSRLAAERAATPQMRAYAHEEAADAVRTSDALDILTPSDHRFAVAAASTDADGVMTGRSAGIDTPAKPDGFGQAANARMPVGSEDIAALGKLSGREFEDFFWAKQLDALSQLRADYRQYIATGDDTALLAIAHRELPKVEHRLLMLSRI